MVFVTDRPDLYDDLYEGFNDDIDMYKYFASTHESVLLCGAGTGRTTIPIIKDGIKVDAIDISKPMLGKFKQKIFDLSENQIDNLNIIEADMREFSLKKIFGCCIIPFSTFNYLLTIDDQNKCLSAVNIHLQVGGELILELLTFNTFHETLKDEKINVIFSKKLKDGRILEYSRKTTFDEPTQLLLQNRYYTFKSDVAVIEKIEVLWKNRLFLTGEIDLLLQKNGFQIKKIYGDYNFGEFTKDSEFLVIKAEKVR